jgi:protein-S-isoprenylcysteine O-methyltransferase Ste14
MGSDLHPLRKGKSAIGRQSIEIGVLWLLSLLLLWFLPFADRRRLLTIEHDYWRYVGSLLCCIAVVVRLLAMKALGEYFSAYITLQSNHRLVQKGIYSHIRHPLYLSLLLAPAGTALVFSSILALPILLLSSIFVVD